jgi:hypothetical protein
VGPVLLPFLRLFFQQLNRLEIVKE